VSALYPQRQIRNLVRALSAIRPLAHQSHRLHRHLQQIANRHQTGLDPRFVDRNAVQMTLYLHRCGLLNQDLDVNPALAWAVQLTDQEPILTPHDV
jgi:hypothetical protein